MTRSRPFGVTVIAIVLVVNAVVAALRFRRNQPDLYSLLARGDLQGLLDPALSVGDYLAILNPILGVVGLGIAVGLWRLERGAWVAAMLWVGVHLGSALLAYFREDPHYVSMVLSVVTVFYLNQRDVQAAFQEETGVRHELSN